MRPTLRSKTTRARAGFTLAEVAVTVVIVGAALTLCMQALNTAKITAVQTRNLKLARELGLFKLGELESGIYFEDIDADSTLADTFAEQGHPEFSWEIALGDDAFAEADPNAPFNSWSAKFEKDKEKQEEAGAEEAEQPYERVKVRVKFRQIASFKDEVVLERWIPWKQVHKTEEAAADAQGTDANASGAQGGSGSGSGSGGSNQGGNAGKK
ncbi:MAG: prepilin-type N-terminal cleavage/methylation domain-containing protein [Planctomycetota bacterium]|nr:MAG: prepilin-type N-terminal cleavage/methylation domain-containing protein [Planctomycetota bacterium]